MKLFRLCKQEGFITFYQPLTQLGFNIDQARTKRTLKRWDGIKNSISREPMSVLDIGCNIGFYSIKLAELGHFVTGIDTRIYTLFAFYAQQALGIKKLSFHDLVLTPKNIKILPSYDCILLLSVFHHWCVSFGKEQAIQMLDIVYKRTKKILFFETAQPDSASDKYRDVLPEMGRKPEEWLRKFFKRKGCHEVKTISYIRGRYLLAVIK